MNVHIRIFFGGMVKFQIFFGLCLICPYFLGYLSNEIFFGVNSRCWVRAYVCMKIESIPPGNDSTCMIVGVLHVLVKTVVFDGDTQHLNS